MFLHRPNYHLHLSSTKSSLNSSPSVGVDAGSQMVSSTTLGTQRPEERIREMFANVELSVSSYDTAWVAMIPSPNSPQFPYYPECVSWLLDNQLPDGSWGIPHRHPFLIKDALSSTLASVLALKRWNIGEEHMKRGLHFIGSNFSLAIDPKQHSPVGFDVIFPGMVEKAKGMGLSLPLRPTAVDDLLHKRDLELKRSNSEGRKAYLAYIAEGLGELQDWDEVMKYQRKNGSLFNSPSTTAAALSHLQDAKCHAYLRSILERFGNAVPTTYPLDICTRLCMVDALERLGISRQFREEIKGVLDETYRCWLRIDEEIYLDTATCALAFRLLRMNGYDVSSDALAQFAEEDLFFNSLGGHLKDMGTVLELYRASQTIAFPNELVLEKINHWSSHFLKQELLKAEMQRDLFHKEIIQEVDYALRFPCYANLERLENRRNIEHYNLDDIHILKTSYRSCNIDRRDIIALAVEDFSVCQSIHRRELENLERWVKESRLDRLKFAREKQTYCYFSVAATLFAPELSDARMSWAKNGVLTTVVDDFFDIGGSRDELVNLINLIEKWNGNSAADCCSEQVEIIYYALYTTINELGAKAFAWQGRSVTDHLIDIWLTLLKSMMREAEWTMDKSTPTMDEYMANGYVSFALGPIVLPALYFVGPKLSEEVVVHPEFHNLFKLMSTCGRLLNDIQGFQREGKEGKLNSVSLRMVYDDRLASEEEAVREIRGVIDNSRRELLRLVLERQGSVVPSACKDLFWKAIKVLHLFYLTNDGFSSPTEMVSAVSAVIHEPIKPPSYCQEI
ncbi:terpenoid cyclases/Protein prenyltransferases superfamily protein isoform X2 [Tasmannia lanceolata]|uniref:terpenoid cyclases/Protein prenyltransferases superfamily protein isoform X2 n=1 Tax=Tasmannia lanceolata TaxID=3420 RepID=UPI004062C2C5